MPDTATDFGHILRLRDGWHPLAWCRDKLLDLGPHVCLGRAIRAGRIVAARDDAWFATELRRMFPDA